MQPPSTDVKERVLLNLYIPSGPFLGRTLPFTSRTEHFIHTSAKLCEVTVQSQTYKNLYCTNKETIYLEDSLIYVVMLMLTQT